MNDDLTSERSYFGLIEELGSIDDISDTGVFLEKAKALYGLKNIAYLATNLPQVERQEPYIAVTYSDEWVRHYKERGFVRIDPTLSEGFRSILPLDWRGFKTERSAVRKLFSEAAESGVGRNGITFPIRGRHGEKAIFTITSDLHDAEWAKDCRHFVRDFQLMSCHVHQAILRAEGIDVKPCVLSPRELECLKWAAAGKTVSDIATILSISDRTVRFYLDLARHKLGTMNITHSVARAINLSLI